MSRRIYTTLLAAGILLAVVVGGYGEMALGALPSSPCLNAAGFSCMTFNVPLNRTGALPGALTLSIERLQAGSAPSEDAVVALAGGPGQAAIPLGPAVAHMVAPALGSRDLIVFDQRGTGTSGPLSCNAIEGPTPNSATIGGLFERCAHEIGAARGSFTTLESVNDIEAIRQALGYRRLVLFGVSYGTKVALQYAERYPSNVEALLLDSVVPTGHADPFSTAMFTAIAPALRGLCASGACASITADPAADVARLGAWLGHHSLRGPVYDGRGHRHTVSLSEANLLDLVAAGDLNPTLRALLPASVQSALHGDASPLLRLELLSQGLIPNVPVTPAASGGIDEALFVDTTCEEALLPWQRSAPPATRLSEALGALHGLPASVFYPFDPSVAWEDSILPGCAQWPNVADPPPPVGALPDVPTLLLSGAQDVRTPTPNAQLVAQRIPGAQLVVVPFTGHSVLGSDFTGCAQKAVSAFFADLLVQGCPSVNPFPPTPVTPTNFSHVRPVGGVPGRAGSTLAVVLDTIIDLERQAIGARLQADQALPSGSSFGGLRGGYAQLTSSELRLRRLSFVSGVQVSGTFPIRQGRLVRSTLRVEGVAAARGTVRIGGGPLATGTLGGRHFQVNLAKVRLAGVSGHTERLQADGLDGAQPLTLSFPAPVLAHIR